jgi:uncharacterized protein YkwD
LTKAIATRVAIAWLQSPYQIHPRKTTMKNPLCLLFLLPALAELSAQPPDQPLIAQVESAIVERTNEFRKENDLQAVARNEELTKAALQFARFMAETDEYGHQADGKTPAERAKEVGYKYCVVRENIAYRTSTNAASAGDLIEAFFQGWLDSPGHRENMSADYVTQLGVGVATTDKQTYYAVQLFGRPKSAAIQLKVTNESSETQTLVVEANDSSDEFQLPARSVVTMLRCYPTKLSLEGQATSVDATSSSELVITPQGRLEQN